MVGAVGGTVSSRRVTGNVEQAYHHARSRGPTPDLETQLRICIHTKSCILCTVKPVTFVGGSDEELRAFPAVARHRAGYQLYLVQMRDAPHDSKPMPSVGPGCREIRVRESSGAFRVFFVASVGNPRAALALGKHRYQQMMEIVGGKGHT